MDESDPSGGRPEAGHRGGPRPTPARQGVEAAPRDPPPPIELPFRTVHDGDEEWIVREGGRTASGSAGDSRAPLLLLLFARAAEPELLIKELLIPGRRLDELSDTELVGLLARARAHRVEKERQEVFPDTRKKGGRGL